MIKAEKNKIAPSGLFYILYISRLVVSLTYVQSVTTGILNPDFLVSIILAMTLTIVFSVPAIYCIHSHKNPFSVNWLSCLISLYFLFSAGISISRFSYFASTVVNQNANIILFCGIVAVCCAYACSLGIEGISRFCAFTFILLILTTLIAIMFNIDSFEEINLYPTIQSSTDSIFSNAVIMASNTTEISVFLLLSKKVNGKSVKGFIFSILGSFLTIFLLVYFAIGTMGDSVSLYPFPIFTLFQTANAGGFERLDILHISFWIFGIFVKVAVLLYCSAVSFKPLTHKTKSILFGVVSFLISVLITQIKSLNMLSPIITLIPFLIFCVAIPILTLIFKKENKGETVLENF